MIVFIRDKKYPARVKLSGKRIGFALHTLMENRTSFHSGRGTFLLPLLNILERKKIPYILTAIPDRGYQIDLNLTK